MGYVKSVFIFWDIMAYSPLKIDQSFGRGSCLHVQGRKVSQTRNQREAGSKTKMEANDPPKLRLTFNVLHVVTSQKTSHCSLGQGFNPGHSEFDRDVSKLRDNGMKE
jgi:hypothetical protein